MYVNDNVNDNVNDIWVNFVRPLRGPTNFILRPSGDNYLKGGIEVIVLDETKLSKGTLAMIGHDYGMLFNYREFNNDDYEEFITNVVDRFKFNIDEFKEKLIEAIKNGIKVELKVK